MQPSVRLQEEHRTSRRTIADALDVVRQHFGIDTIPRGQIWIGPLLLPSGQWTALVDVVFPALGCRVSLPTSARFRSISDPSPLRQVFGISRLSDAEVGCDGSVLLLDGTRVRAVEVIPSNLPYKPSECDERILRHLVAMANSSHCYRNMREGLPEHLQHQVPDLYALDYGRVRTIQPPPLKLIRAYIEDHDPELRVSNQKIADALAMCGVRVPRRRPRAASSRAAARATI